MTSGHSWSLDPLALRPVAAQRAPEPTGPFAYTLLSLHFAGLPRARLACLPPTQILPTAQSLRQASHGPRQTKQQAAREQQRRRLGRARAMRSDHTHTRRDVGAVRQRRRRGDEEDCENEDYLHFPF